MKIDLFRKVSVLFFVIYQIDLIYLFAKEIFLFLVTFLFK